MSIKAHVCAFTVPFLAAWNDSSKIGSNIRKTQSNKKHYQSMYTKTIFIMMPCV
jgi:hypothetical protein